MAVWFTSDTHFNHAKIIEYSQRPFADVEEMTEVMIERWNKRVKPGDLIYHLGDFALSWGRQHADLVDGILSRLNGQKWLIVGNHDRDEVVENDRWVKVKDLHEIKVDLGGVHKQRIMMCHYPLRSWSQMHRGSWMLHGHCHGNLSDVGGKILDVGVDVWGYAPVSLEWVAEYMGKREVVVCDHHTLGES
jgi:calcineurin-like phosphoesterase family protein